MKPLAIDLFCGLGGWAEGLLETGWDVVGFDIEVHDYGLGRYPGLLAIQDVRTLHGSQFRNASLIVASPPCQAYSYRAMPWSRAKALPPPDNTLFFQCWRIQREASEAAGRKIPLIVENVRGAQKWVGRARWNYGSYYLWGDVPALMPMTFHAKKFNRDGTAHGQGAWFKIADSRNRGSKGIPHRTTGHWTNEAEHRKVPGIEMSKVGFNVAAAQRYREHIKQGGDLFNAEQMSMSRRFSSRSNSRKAASAMIAKIPRPLARHIGRVFRPDA